MPNSYIAGQLVQVSGLFEQNNVGVPIAANWVTLKYAVTVNNVRGVITSIAGATMSNPSNGLFVWDLDTTNQPGYWEYEFVGAYPGSGPVTPDYQGVGVNSFYVTPLPL